MGITKSQLKKLGFKESNKVFDTKDEDTLVYKMDNGYIFSLPRNKTFIFYSYGFNPKTGETPSEPIPFVHLDDIGYFELMKMLKDIKHFNTTLGDNIWTS
jgi:hypothetical protein